VRIWANAAAKASVTALSAILLPRPKAPWSGVPLLSLSQNAVRSKKAMNTSDRGQAENVEKLEKYLPGLLDHAK